MAQLSTHRGDLDIQGNLSASSMSIPAGTVTNSDIASVAGIEATKLEHRYAIQYQQADGSDVATATVPVHIVRGATATIQDVEVVCVDAPEGGDKTFTVDVHYGNASSALATVLSAPISYGTANPDLTVVGGTLATSALTAGDTLVVIVTASGSSGNQGQGLIVNIALSEDAQ
jgi:hypothetical protein